MAALASATAWSAILLATVLAPGCALDLDATGEDDPIDVQALGGRADPRFFSGPIGHRRPYVRGSDPWQSNVSEAQWSSLMTKIGEAGAALPQCPGSAPGAFDMGCFFNAAPAPVPADPVVPLRSFYRIGGQEWTGNCSMTITEVKAEPDGTQVLEGYTAAHCLTDDDGAILPIHSVAIYSEVALGARLFVHEDYPGTESGAWIAIGSYDDLLTTDVAKLRLWMPRAILIEPACKRTCDDDDDERDARVAGYPAVLQDAANRTWTEESATLPIMAVSSELPSLMLGHSLLHCADLPNDDHWGGISGGGITIANPECPSGRDLVAMVRGTFSNRVCEKRDEIIGFMGGCVPASDDIWTIYQLGLVDRLQ